MPSAQLLKIWHFILLDLLQLERLIKQIVEVKWVVVLCPELLMICLLIEY